MQSKIAATSEGKITGLWCHGTADHGAFDSCADPTKFPAGFMSICTGSYDIPVAWLGVDGVYTTKAPGGVACRCSFRVTEAAYFIERMIEVLAIKLNMDAAELRRINFIRKEQFPHHSALGWEYDSGDYHTAWDKALKAVDYTGLRAEQATRLADFKAGKTRSLMGIGLSFFPEIVGAAQMIAAYLLEVHDNDLEWDVDRFVVKGVRERYKTMKECAYAAYKQAIPGLEAGLEALLIGQIVGFVQALRREELEKTPGVAEALDFAAALAGLGGE